MTTRNEVGSVLPSFSAALLEAIIESAPVAMILSDEHRGIHLVNREAEALFGYSRDELIGQQIEMLLPSLSQAAHVNVRRSFFAKPVARRMGSGRELFGARKDGAKVPIEIALTPIDSGEGLFVLSVVIDITERKRLEEDVRRAH